MSNWAAPDEWLVVFEADNSQARLDVSDESAIDAAVSSFLETGKDSLLHLTFVEGDEYVVRASRITSWFRSTPEFRERSDAVDAKVKEEKRARGWVDHDG